jgi:glutathione S-transferase
MTPAAATAATSAGGRLFSFPNSPYGRIGRVLIREWALPVEEEIVPFGAPAPVAALNPLGQVPVLVLGGAPLFPALPVVERLWELAGARPAAYMPERERQTLATILAGGDALVSALYQRWAGLRSEGPNNLGFDPATRGFARFEAVLDWLEAGRLREGLTVPGVAIASFLLWSDARGGPAWWGRPLLEALVAALSERESFRATRPRSWRPGEPEMS